MRFMEELKEYTKEIWEAYEVHPFIQGLEKGDLPMEKFQFYMIQDYLYLWDYAKLFALGALKCEKKEWISSFAQSMDLTLNGEMGIHRGYMKRLGDFFGRGRGNRDGFSQSFLHKLYAFCIAKRWI